MSAEVSRIAEAKAVRGFERAFVLHFHAEWSIALVRRGTSRARIGPAWYDVGEGDVVRIPPFVPHVCNPDRKGHWSYDLLLAEDGRVASSAVPDFGSVVVDRSCGECRALFADALSGLGADALLRHLSRHRSAARARREALRGDPRMEEAARLLAASLARPPRLEGLARSFGFDAPAFIRAFTRAYGITPHAWIICRRVDRAKALLRGGAALADAALEVGFADQSHFSRHFTRIVGLTPAAWTRADDNFVQDRRYSPR